MTLAELDAVTLDAFGTLVELDDHVERLRAALVAAGVKRDAAAIEDAFEHWVDGAELIVAATDDMALKDRIAEAAARRGRYCNRADGLSTFLIPSVVDRENYKVAVSTEGRSPGMSKYLRLELEGLLPPRYDKMIELQEDLRQEAKRRLTSQKVREERLWEVLGDRHVWDLLETDPTEARKLALDRLVR
jgi:siroheme synthase-like protein